VPIDSSYPQNQGPLDVLTVSTRCLYLIRYGFLHCVTKSATKTNRNVESVHLGGHRR